jgi:hypothetical protein
LLGTFAAGALAKRALGAESGGLVLAALLVAIADAVGMLLILAGVI